MGNLVAEVSLATLLGFHRGQQASATMAVVPRKSPSADLKPGKAPKGVS